MKSIAFVAVLLAAVYSATDGLMCYQCSYNVSKFQSTHVDNQLDARGSPVYNSNCLSNWNQVPLSNCSTNENYCYILITELGRGKFTEIYRGCTDEPLPNGTNETEDGIDRYSSCQEDGCNSVPSSLPGLMSIVLLLLTTVGLAF